MNLHRNTRSQTVKVLVRKAAWLMLAIAFLTPRGVLGGDLEEAQAAKLLSTGQVLAEKTHYLEAFDLLQEARDMLGEPNMKNAGVLSDVYFALAQAKIKARIHQGFPAHYVKTALEDVQMANKLRELRDTILKGSSIRSFLCAMTLLWPVFARQSISIPVQLRPRGNSANLSQVMNRNRSEGPDYEKSKGTGRGVREF
jgi:hypothetical protein